MSAKHRLDGESDAQRIWIRCSSCRRIHAWDVAGPGSGPSFSETLARAEAVCGDPHRGPTADAPALEEPAYGVRRTRCKAWTPVEVYCFLSLEWSIRAREANDLGGLRYSGKRADYDY